MFKWLHYWKLGRQHKRDINRMLAEALLERPYTPTTEEVLDFIDEMNAQGNKINTSHCMESVKNKTWPVNSDITALETYRSNKKRRIISFMVRSPKV